MTYERDELGIPHNFLLVGGGMFWASWKHSECLTAFEKALPPFAAVA